MTSSRRAFITGLVSLVAAPAIVRAGSLMPVRTMLIDPYDFGSALTAVKAMNLLSTYEVDIALREIFKIMAVPPHYLRERR